MQLAVRSPRVRGAPLAAAIGMLVFGLVLSLAIGVSLGMLGGGGSILTVPVLRYLFGLPVHDAIAGSLAVVGATSAVALIPYARAGLVRWRLGAVFGAASMMSAFAGGRVGGHIPEPVLITAFAAVMLAAGSAMLLRRQGQAHVPRSFEVGRILAIGAGVGLVTGVLGAGGGFIIVPALALLGGVPMRAAVGTSLLVIAMNSAAGLAGTISHASIPVGTVAAVGSLALAGSMVGARLARRVSAGDLQRAFGAFVIVVGAVILAVELA